MCRGELSTVIARLMCKCCEAGGSGTEELEMASLFSCCHVIRECHVKVNPNRKNMGYATCPPNPFLLIVTFLHPLEIEIE